jgi:hypothetical protein
MSQTAYSITIPAAVPGLQADMGAASFVRSMHNEDAASMPFGIGVKQGTADDGCKVPTLSTDPIVGITLFTHDVNMIGLTSDPVAGAAITNGTVANVMRKGLVYVQVEEAVVAGGPAYCRYATSVNTPALVQKGAWRTSSDTNGGNPTAVLVHGARYQSSAAPAGFAVLEFDGLINS